MTTANMPEQTTSAADAPEGDAPVAVPTLTADASGVWEVKTRDSVHLFDFITGTVTRIPGEYAQASPDDHARFIRTIEACTVGERGYWTMHTPGWSATIDYYWHSSSVIQSITQLRDDAGTPVTDELPGERGRAGERDDECGD